MRTPLTPLFLILAAGCGVGELGTTLPPGETAVQFHSPTPGSVWVRDRLDHFGALLAPVEVEVSALGGVAAVRLEDDQGEVLGMAEGSSLELTANLPRDGRRTLIGIALDGAGRELAAAEVEIEVVPPPVSDCYGWLDAYQVAYERGPARQGVPEPVTVALPLSGIAYRYRTGDAPREDFLMDCQLALSLAKAAPFLRSRGLVEVEDVGVYNYRCIGGGTPPDCPNGVSQHAYARAIDIAGLTGEDGTFYSVLDDWVIDPAGTATCAADAAGEKNALLHELICDLKAAGVWNIVLTPNYNAAHRDHFHVDLTEGSDFIRREEVPGVDLGPDQH